MNKENIRTLSKINTELKKQSEAINSNSNSSENIAKQKILVKINNLLAKLNQGNLTQSSKINIKDNQQKSYQDKNKKRVSSDISRAKKYPFINSESVTARSPPRRYPVITSESVIARGPPRRYPVIISDSGRSPPRRYPIIISESELERLDERRSRTRTMK